MNGNKYLFMFFFLLLSLPVVARLQFNDVWTHAPFFLGIFWKYLELGGKQTTVNVDDKFWQQINDYLEIAAETFKYFENDGKGNFKLEQLFRAHIHIKASLYDYTKILENYKMKKARLYFQENFVESYKERGLTKISDFIRYGLTADDSLTKELLDVVADKYRCNVEKLEEFKDSYLFLFSAASELKLAYKKLSRDGSVDCSKDECDEGIEIEKKDNEKHFVDLEKAITKRINNCQTDHVIKYIKQYVTVIEDPKNLLDKLGYMYPHMWFHILEGLKGVSSQYVKAGSHVIQLKDILLIYGLKNETLNSEEDEKAKQLIQRTLNETKCEKPYDLECIATAIVNALLSHGFDVSSLVGLKFLQKDTITITAQSSTAVQSSEIEVNESKALPSPVRAILNLAGYGKTYHIKVSVDVTKSEKYDQSESKTERKKMVDSCRE